MPIFPKLIYRFKVITVIILSEFLIKIDTLNGSTNTSKRKTNLTKKSHFKNYCKTIIVIIQPLCQKKNQKHRIDSPEIHPLIFGQLFLTRLPKLFSKIRIFNKYLEYYISVYITKNINSSLTPCTKLNLRQIIHVNIKSKTTNLIKHRRISSITWGQANISQTRDQSTLKNFKRVNKKSD